jgi:two-component system, LuxR family, response regulator FixJ
MTHRATVFVVDDDARSLQSICGLIRQANLPVRSFSSGTDFLRQYTSGEAGCLILDIRMPEVDGLAVVERLAAKNVCLPVIIVTGYGDVSSCVRAFKMGVCEFLEKPIDEHQLLSSVRKALARNTRLLERPSSSRLSQMLSQLTRREKEVMEFLAAGKSIKEIAKLCGVTVQSVWKHQQHIFTKFGVQNEVELVLLISGREAARQDSSEPAE